MLHTKLHIPQTAGKHLVARQKLRKWFNHGLDHKLTAITAPAGFGKTTLLSAWAQESRCKVAWVSLDRHDNDLVRFWSYIIAAMKEKQPNFNENIQLISSGQSYIQLLDRLIDQLQSIQGELALILDDYHVIELGDIHESIAYLLEYLPTNIHIYIASRTQLLFPTARLLANGEMLTITMEDLRFELEEGICFFRDCMNLQLRKEDAAMFVDQTEGWVSGLHLAAISLKKSSDQAEFIRHFSGRQRGIAQYLLEEVLGRQTEEMKNILLQTSVLTRINKELCEVVTGQSGGQLLLESLERQQLFISVLDDRGEWYRYHHLFSDFLQQQFRIKHPKLWEEAHANAALWLEANGEPEVAVEHWLNCGRFEEAATLIEKHLNVLQDHRVSLLRWLKTIPEAILSRKPLVQLLFLKMLSELGNFHMVDQLLRNLETKLDHPVWQPWLGAYYFLSAETALYCRDLSRSLYYLELYNRFETKGLGSALQMIAGNSMAGINFESLLSFFDSFQDAEKFLLTCIRIWEEKGNYSFLGYFYYFYSELLLEWGRLEEAESLLGNMLYHSRWQPFTRIWFFSTIAVANIYMIKGETASALAIMEEIPDRLNQTPDRDLFIKKWNAEMAYLSSLAGQTDQVRAWIGTCGLKPTDSVPSSYRDYYILARALMEVGQTSEALMLLEQIFQITKQHNWLWDQIKVLIVQSMALDKHGQEEEAFIKLESALHLAEPQGMIRSFINEEKTLGSLLVRYVRYRQSGKSSSTLVSMFYVKKLLNKMSILLKEQWDIPSFLTSQESRILHLVELGYKNREIAEQLGVSAETVKTHLKNIFQKLEAKGRVQAINIAKELHLI